MSQFIKFPTSEPPLESLCYPCRRRAERSQAAMPGLRSSEPGLAGLLPSLLPRADVFCPQTLQRQALAARVNGNKYISFHRRDGGEELLFPAVPCLWPCGPSHLAPLHLENFIPFGFQGFLLAGNMDPGKVLPPGGALHVPPLPNMLGFILFPFYF